MYVLFTDYSYLRVWTEWFRDADTQTPADKSPHRNRRRAERIEVQTAA